MQKGNGDFWTKIDKNLSVTRWLIIAWIWALMFLVFETRCEIRALKREVASNDAQSQSKQ